MSTKNEDLKPTDNMGEPKQEASACGPGCSCHAGGPSNRVRGIVGAIIILAAGALVARAMIKNNSASAEKTTQGFASLPTVEQPSVPLAGAVPATNDAPAVPVPVAVKELGALSDLNAVAADTGGCSYSYPVKTIH